MKEGRRAGGITAGPESKVLDGATWEERADSVNKSFGMPDNVDYKVGAASKGIIQRDYQHNATVYKSVYAKNPFDNVSAEELAEYQRIVDLKSRGEGNPNLSMTSRWPKSKPLFHFADPLSPAPDYGNTTGEVSRGAGGLSPLMSPTTDTEHDGILLTKLTAFL